MRDYFDSLIREGRATDAMRLFTRTYYESGKMGHTRLTLLIRVADDNDRLKTENAALVKELEGLRRVAEAYQAVLEIIANIEEKTEQKPYGTVIYTPTMESIQRFAGQVLARPESANETLKALADLEKEGD